MMDETAIREIQKSTVVNNLNTVLGEMKDIAQVIATPDGYNVINLEDHQEHRNALRGTLATTDIDSFRAFVLAHLPLAAVNTALLTIDQKTKQAVCYLDFKTLNGDPGHCRFKALFRLMKTADYSSLLYGSSSKFTMNQFANFIQDHRAMIQLYAVGSVPISNVTGINAIRNVTIEKIAKTEHEQSPLVAAKSSTERLDAQSKNSNLPDTFDFTCIPYMGLNSRTFECRVSLNVEDLHSKNEPRFIFKIINLDKDEELMGLELKQKLDEQFVGTNEKMSTLLGDFTA